MKSRNGILAGGNWIVDFVKMVDTYPSQDALANIRSQSSGNGGSPYNILIDLARLDVGIPLEAVGLIGDDANGRGVREDCRRHGIATGQLQTTTLFPTSYTDVFTVESTGRRTFFHARGANAALKPEHFHFSKTRAKIFHLGYLLLMDELDQPDRRYGTKAGSVLAQARQAGLSTSVDVVSEDSDRFASVVIPTLPYIDYLFLNELEAGKITGKKLRTQRGLNTKLLLASARELLAGGVKGAVIVHFPEGALAVTADAKATWQASVRIPQSKIEGTVGAGDAFAAGVLSGLHQELPMADCLKRGVCIAATCLLSPTSSGGIKTVTECIRFGSRHGFSKIKSV
jgi:sugar/nucleoside kinase (ribokinase family)